MFLSTIQQPANGLANTKWAFTVRRARREDAIQLITHFEVARAGDLLLAQVKSIGQHKALRLTTARQSSLYIGDLIVVSVGARYAPDQFEASADIDREGCDLIAAGGLAGRMLARHGAMKNPTVLRPLGLLADAGGQVLNLAHYALPERHQPATLPMIAVLGTSMNSGKTTTAASVVHGLTQAGLNVGAAKITGTGSPNDFCAYLDAGAGQVVDFTDAGYASTYLTSLKELEQIFNTLTQHLQDAGCDAIVLEVADGVYQMETAGLMASKTFQNHVDAVLFAAPDALGAVVGVQQLQAYGLPVVGVSGLISRSPLACREAAENLTVPVVGCADLHEPSRVSKFLDRTRRHKTGSTSPAHLQSSQTLVI